MRLDWPISPRYLRVFHLLSRRRFTGWLAYVSRALLETLN